MIIDIHNHTYYSECGKDHPEKLIEAAIKGGIEIFGISDHNYGIDGRMSDYINQLAQLREKYKDKIRLLIGIEISTYPYQIVSAEEDCADFDYCLLEQLQNDDTAITDIPGYAKKFKCKVGIAHTDLFKYCRDRSLDPLKFFTSLAEAGVFWEMNVNYDSIHCWNEHQYVKDLLSSVEQQEIIKASGIALSVGFDGHRIEDYDPQRCIDACKCIEEAGLKLIEF